jgi:hypothetical protein
MPAPFGSDSIRRVVVGSVAVVVPTCRLPNRTSAINSLSINRRHERNWSTSASNLPAGDDGGADRQVTVERCRTEGWKVTTMYDDAGGINPCEGVSILSHQRWRQSRRAVLMLFPLCGGGGTPRLRLLPAGCKTIAASRRSSVGPLGQPMDLSMRQSFLPPSLMSITSEHGGGGSLRPPVAAWISSSGGGGGSHDPWGWTCGTSHGTAAVCCARKSGDPERATRLFFHTLLTVMNRIVMEFS